MSDCRFCARAYLSDNRVWETECLNCIEVLCGVVREGQFWTDVKPDSQKMLEDFA